MNKDKNLSVVLIKEHLLQELNPEARRKDIAIDKARGTTIIVRSLFFSLLDYPTVIFD
jgi:DNA mismatch repair ATPase MutL